jgi:anti-anti-sigma factor
MSQNLQLFEFESTADTLLLTVNGPFMEFRDHDVRNAYNEAYRLLCQPAARHLLVDFSRLEYFGSTFVGILIRLAKKVRQCGGETVLCSLSDSMQEMLRTLMLLENTKTDFFIKPFPDAGQALAYLQSLPPAP